MRRTSCRRQCFINPRQSTRERNLGTHIDLTASDGFTLGAYRAEPQGKPRGGLVVIQEIFGVNHHIRNVCDRFAAQGYVALAPAVFDRIQRDFECGYTPDEIAHARTFIPKIDWDAMMRDTAAAIAAVTSAGKVGIVGYCMGGSVAFLAAAKLDGLSAAVGYYGGQIAKNADDKPKVPTQLHFGDQDQSIPMSDVEIVRAEAARLRDPRLSRRPRLRLRRAGELRRGERRSSRNERTLAWFGKICRLRPEARSEPALGDHDGVAGLHRRGDRDRAARQLAARRTADLDRLALGARAEAAGDRDRGLHRHVGDVGILAGKASPRRG